MFLPSLIAFQDLAPSLGYKSMAYSVTFRAKDRTLEDADVNAAMKKILNGLEGLGIELRK